MEVLYIIPRQQLPVTSSATDDDLRLVDPTGIDVYFTGATGVPARLKRRTGSSL